MAFFWGVKNIASINYQHSTGFEKTGQVIEAHQAFIRPKIYLLTWLLCALIMLIIWSIAVGSYDMPLLKILRSFLGLEQGPQKIVVWDIRMPRITAAIVAGCGLGLSGLASQSLLRNPLASPFTLGISQGSAFGAAFSIVVMGSGGMQQSALLTADTNTVLFAGDFRAFCLMEHRGRPCLKIFRESPLISGGTAGRIKKRYR